MAIFRPMAIFTVVATGDIAKLAAAIRQEFPEDHLAVSPDVWLIAAGGIAKDVSDRLGITEGQNGTGIVFAMSGYYGFASNAIWEWLTLKLKGAGAA